MLSTPFPATSWISHRGTWKGKMAAPNSSSTLNAVAAGNGHLPMQETQETQV